MDPREYLLAYVKQQGGIPKTALKLGIPYPTLCSICNGHRGISKDLASRMAKADYLLDPGRLVWVRPTKTAHRSVAADSTAGKSSTQKSKVA